MGAVEPLLFLVGPPESPLWLELVCFASPFFGLGLLLGTAARLGRRDAGVAGAGAAPIVAYGLITAFLASCSHEGDWQDAFGIWLAAGTVCYGSLAIGQVTGSLLWRSLQRRRQTGRADDGTSLPRP